jgi:hypothetical protein
LRHHPFTHTEAVARVIAGKSLVAVMNIEAPVSGTLRNDLNFFGEYADFLGETHRRLFSISDAAGLASMARSHLALHSVADMLEKWTDNDADGALKIVQRLKPMRSSSILEQDSNEIAFPAGPKIGSDVARFNSGLRDWITFVLHRKGNYAYDADSILQGCVSKHIPPNIIPALFVITTSIVENIIYRTTWDRHVVRFTDESNSCASKRQLIIEWTSEEWLEDDAGIDGVLVKPMVDAQGNKHFGFFLIGVYVRQVGGSAEFSPIGTPRSGFKLLVSLPYDPE